MTAKSSALPMLHVLHVIQFGGIVFDFSLFFLILAILFVLLGARQFLS